MQQTRITQAPSAPADPRPFVVTLPGTPMTGEEVRGVKLRLEALRDELQDAASRRSNISGQLRTADESARPGIIARMQELDSRILQLEKDITANGRLLSAAPALALSEGTTGMPFTPDAINSIADEIIPIVAILSVFVFAPFAIAISRFIWKRAVPSHRPALVDQGTQQRLEQLQHAVDTIAIEVERISEGQRFVTKLLSDRERPALGATVDRR